MEDKKFFQSFKLLLDYQIAMIENSNKLLGLSVELHCFIKNSPFKPAYNGSILDIIGGIGETLTSQILSNILNYQDETKRFPILESFIKRFIKANLVIIKPEITAEKERLDVAVKDKKFALIIENKLHDAPFQRNQLARYIAKLKVIYNEKNVFLIIMPQFKGRNIPTSACRLPLDWRENNDKRKCAVSRHECWCDYPGDILNPEQKNWCSKCDKTIFKRLDCNIVILHDDFSEWLIEEADFIPEKEWPLKSCILQFAYYLKGLYKTRFNNKLNMAINEFLREKLITESSPRENFEKLNETLDEIDQLWESVNNLKGQLSIDLVKYWESNLKKEFPKIVSTLDENGVYSFRLLFEGLWIGCWSGNGKDNENQPYWGIYSEGQANRKQLKMIDLVLKESNMDEYIEPENNFKVWGNTLEGDEVCGKLYRTALSLGYK